MHVWLCSLCNVFCKCQWDEDTVGRATGLRCRVRGVSAANRSFHCWNSPSDCKAFASSRGAWPKGCNDYSDFTEDMWGQGPKWEPRLPSGVIRCSVAAGALSENLHPSLSSRDCFRASRFRAQIWGAVFLAFSIFSFVFRKPTWLKSGHEQIEPSVLPRLYKISLRSTCCRFSLLGVCCLRFT